MERDNYENCDELRNIQTGILEMSFNLDNTILSIGTENGFILCNIIFLACLGKKPWNDLNLVDFFYYDRSSSKQTGIQIAVLFITIGFALFSGILIGFIERFFRISESFSF